ncbi:hypothetical protein RJT34_15308 [Clitoria ternatea]|uniref:Uncharacterized protein n=1 Tax=Clitoria ternatea TaxID=43366 RepID=A0AAN9JS63_CLITE
MLGKSCTRVQMGSVRMVRALRRFYPTAFAEGSRDPALAKRRYVNGDSLQTELELTERRSQDIQTALPLSQRRKLDVPLT